MLCAGVGLGMFPYLAVPVGDNTNVPASTIAILISLLIATRRYSPPVGALIFAFAPAVGTLVLIASGLFIAPSAIKGAVLFLLLVNPLLVLPMIVRNNDLARIKNVLCLTLVASSLFGFYQRLALDRGRIPFIENYVMPGYPAIPASRGGFSLSTQRVFGWFPEPSFMAGSMCVSIVLIVVINLVTTGRIDRVTWMVLGVSGIAIFMTKSGLVAPFLVFLILVILCFKRTARQSKAVLAVASVLGVITAYITFSGRLSNAGWSWGDRYASIYGSIRFVAADPLRALFGLGRDGASYSFSTLAIYVDDLNPQFYPRGVYSAFVRYVVEGGVVFGLIPLLLLMLSIYTSLRGSIGRLSATMALFAVAVVPTIAVSYDSAAMIWIACGLLLAVGRNYSGRWTGQSGVSETLEGRGLSMSTEYLGSRA